MRVRQYFSVAVAMLWLIAFTSCEKENSPLGVELQPESSIVKAHTAVFQIDAKTVPFHIGSTTSSEDGYHSILVSSPYSYLGSLPDKYFKTTSCEYLCQLYVPAGFKFTEEPLAHRVDSTRINLYYTSFSGDSIAPITFGAYKISKSIPFSKYSISDVSAYGPFTPLGELSVLPSYGSSSYGSDKDGVVRIVSIPISNKLGQEIYDKSRASDPIFSSQAAFNKYFPGIYLKTNAGTGAILHISETTLCMYYTMKDSVKSSSGKLDSVAFMPHKQELRLTPEVPQLMRFHHSKLESLLLKTNGEEVYYTNIKSPAGVITEIRFPTVMIKKMLEKAPEGYERHLISAPFHILADVGNTGVYNLPIPDNLLILPKDSVAAFFEENRTELTQAQTAYLSQLYSQASTNYSFSNIASLLNKHMKEHPQEDLTAWVLPVSRSLGSSGYGGGQNTTRLTNMLKPTGLKIKYTKESRKLSIIYHERKKGLAE